MLTASHIFPYYQGDSTIFHMGNFLKHIPDSKNLLNSREKSISTTLECSQCKMDNYLVIPREPQRGDTGSNPPRSSSTSLKYFALIAMPRTAASGLQSSKKLHIGRHNVQHTNIFPLQSKEWRNIPLNPK